MVQNQCETDCPRCGLKDQYHDVYPVETGDGIIFHFRCQECEYEWVN